MTFGSAPSTTSADLTQADLRQHLKNDMVACRQSTLSLVESLTEHEFRQQAHPNFSPVGWHLGHIAFTESLWLLQQLAQASCPYPQYQRLFAADGLPKEERGNLPDLPTILAFLQDIRDRAFTYLETAPVDDQLRLWRWLLQHESQHAETATYVLALHRRTPIQQTSEKLLETPLALGFAEPASTQNMVRIAGGEFVMGSDAIAALDNERPANSVKVADYWIDQTPVTMADYAKFIAAGGYQNSQWWDPKGWSWVRKHDIERPLYWSQDPTMTTAPVCGISWYEADAYACFVGKRLPTEAEWERAARWHPERNQMQTYPWGEDAPTVSRGNFGSAQQGITLVGQYPSGRSASGCDDLIGNVWEWTETWFAGYPEFAPYPYPGYSQAYFDRAHRVLRGGSWATRPWVLRPTFRNWYHPWMQEVFAGFRCALSA